MRIEPWYQFWRKKRKIKRENNTDGGGMARSCLCATCARSRTQPSWPSLAKPCQAHTAQIPETIADQSMEMCVDAATQIQLQGVFEQSWRCSLADCLLWRSSPSLIFVLSKFPVLGECADDWLQ